MWDKQRYLGSLGVVSLIILIRKRRLILFGTFFVILTLFSSYAGKLLFPAKVPVFSEETAVPSVTVVIDPGHGGEDGGAVSQDGISESRLNLAVATQINDLMRFFGQPTIMTRTEDISIHTEGDTIRARKASDIHNRVALVNQTENAVLLSIHQNSLPSSPVTHGAQVFWNRQPNAEELAHVVQDTLNTVINQGNAKHPKQIPDTIYLMKHTEAPAILVECGFLSNTEETRNLQNPSHQTKLAAAITIGYLRYRAGEDIP